MTPAQIETLWTLLAQTWGAKFIENYGPKPNDAWSAALVNLTPDQAKFALRKLIDAGSPFPPTLPEFASLAKGSPRSEVRYDGNGVAHIYGSRPAILSHQKPAMTDEQIELRRREMYGALGKRIPGGH